MYTHLGFRSPFILGIILAFVDFLGRILIIEKQRGSQGPSAAPQLTDEEKAEETPTTGQSTESSTTTPEPPVSPANVKFAKVLLQLIKSPRAVVAGVIGIGYGCVGCLFLFEGRHLMHCLEFWLVSKILFSLFAYTMSGALPPRE